MLRLPRLLPVATSRNAAPARGSAMSARAEEAPRNGAAWELPRHLREPRRDVRRGLLFNPRPGTASACGACSFPECSGSGSRENAHSDLCLCQSASRSRSRPMSRSAIAESSSTAVTGGSETFSRVACLASVDPSTERAFERAPESPSILTSTRVASSMTLAVRFSVPSARSTPETRSPVRRAGEADVAVAQAQGGHLRERGNRIRRAKAPSVSSRTRGVLCLTGGGASRGQPTEITIFAGFKR